MRRNIHEGRLNTFIGDLAAVFPKVFNTRSIQGKDLYFFRDHNEFGRIIAKLQLKSK